MLIEQNMMYWINFVQHWAVCPIVHCCSVHSVRNVRSVGGLTPSDPRAGCSIREHPCQNLFTFHNQPSLCRPMWGTLESMCLGACSKDQFADPLKKSTKKSMWKTTHKGQYPNHHKNSHSTCAGLAVIWHALLSVLERDVYLLQTPPLECRQER